MIRGLELYGAFGGTRPDQGGTLVSPVILYEAWRDRETAGPVPIFTAFFQLDTRPVGAVTRVEDELAGPRAYGFVRRWLEPILRLTPFYLVPVLRVDRERPAEEHEKPIGAKRVVLQADIRGFALTWHPQKTGQPPVDIGARRWFLAKIPRSPSPQRPAEVSAAG
jgi:hypothetical protein